MATTSDFIFRCYLRHMKKCLLLLFFVPLFLSAQWQLSDQGEIHVVTCGPYQGELYSAFGHSAIRVKDPVRGFDLIYNYGVFDFDQPNFYLNFARGNLLYKLAVMDYHGFVNMYKRENRFVHEQVLNIPDSSKQMLFNYLQWNALPENSHYQYDYFYDNCATRIRDAVEAGLGDRVQFNPDYAEPGKTIRELCDLYLGQQPWGDLGIDLCLGIPMDKEASTYEYMFLPDYVELAFADAEFKTTAGSQPLVKKNIVTFKPREESSSPMLFSPLTVFSILLILGAWLSYQGFKKNRSHLWFDLILQTTIGLIGWLLLVLWFFTDHRAAAVNMNVLWAFPLYFPLVFFLLKRQPPKWISRVYRILAVLQLLLLIAWFFLPQDLNNSLIPLVLLMALRNFYISHRTAYLAFFNFKTAKS